MSKYRARYKGSSEEVLSDGISPLTASRSFVEKVGFKPIPVEVWNDRWITFDLHIDEQRARQKEAEKEEAIRQKEADEEAEEEEANRRKEEAILAELIVLTQRIKSVGFQELTNNEIVSIGGYLDELLTSSSNTASEERCHLAKAMLMDEHAYKFYTLRSNTRSTNHIMHLTNQISRSTNQQQAMLEAMNVNLSDISNKTSGVKMASMFTGMAAARHLGEEIAEDFGGED